MPLAPGRSYGVVVGNVPLRGGDFYVGSLEDNITATAGGNQATAYPLRHQTNRITTVATAADSVALPVATAGVWVVIINHGANPVQVYGQGTDTINDIATATGIAQMPNSVALYACSASGSNAVAGAWYTDGAANGFSKGFQTVSTSQIAANSAGTQAAGTAVTTAQTNVTAAGANYGITLPVSAPGMQLLINNISSQTVKVFPNAAGTTTETINALSANAAISMLTATSALFTCNTAGQWYTAPRVPS